MTTPTTTPREALAAAAQKASIAADALAAAERGLPASQQALSAAETKAAELLAAAALGESSATRAAVDKARAEIARAKSDIEWAAIQKQAAETAHLRASEEEVRAHRRVIAEDYLRAHLEWNDPEAREHVLMEQLRKVLFELVPLVRARRAAHTALVREVGHFPPAERGALFQGLEGKPIRSYDDYHQRGLPPELDDAIKGAVRAIDEEERAKAQAAEQDRLARPARQ